MPLGTAYVKEDGIMLILKISGETGYKVWFKIWFKRNLKPELSKILIKLNLSRSFSHNLSCGEMRIEFPEHEKSEDFSTLAT